MIRKLLLSVAALVVIGFASGTASARHNPSAKADGDMRPYWNQGPRANHGPSIQSRSNVASPQSYRRYSYAPTVTPIAPMAPVETVRENNSTWVSPVMESASAPAVAAAAPSTQSYRRFSYQPSANGTTAHKPPYTYSKTDPRRYSN